MSKNKPSYDEVVDALAECVNYLEDEDGNFRFLFADPFRSKRRAISVVPEEKRDRIINILDRAQGRPRDKAMIELIEDVNRSIDRKHLGSEYAKIVKTDWHKKKAGTRLVSIVRLHDDDPSVVREVKMWWRLPPDDDKMVIIEWEDMCLTVTAHCDAVAALLLHI